MPILLREYIGYDVNNQKNPLSFKEYKETTNNKSEVELQEWQQENPEQCFTAKIEAIHADFSTINFTRYRHDCLKESLSSWTNPYKIPVIMYHNDYDGQVIGRVINANMENGQRNTSLQALFLDIKVPHYRTREDIREGILDTVSVGMSGLDVRCSICGSNIAQGDFCEHQKGYTYDGKTCYWDVYEAVAKEVSFVIVPSDKYAGVVSWYDPWREESKEHDSTVVKRKRPISLQTSESENINDSNKRNNIEIKESCQSSTENKERKTTTLDLKEAEQKISSLETANKALSGDKAALQRTIDTLNNDKITLQEQVKELETKIEAKELDLTNEKSLREAAEKENEKLTEEVRTSLVDTFLQLRESAGKPKLENAKDRSIDSLRDSIADLRMELTESANTNKDNDTQKEIIDTKNTVNNVSLTEGASKPNESQDTVAPKKNETFEL